MNGFTYVRAKDIGDAVARKQHAQAQFIAGGTNLIDLMKESVLRPDEVVDINPLPLKKIERLADGTLRLGALATNAETAYHPEVEKHYPLLADAILAGASAQLRNMATNGGNLLQRTRCYYFYDVNTACNKRQPGSGCGALRGVNRIHAILGASDHCIAVHPSDMAVALSALNAQVQVSGPRGSRTIPFGDFHRLPGDQPEVDTTLQKDELITSIDLPAESFADHFVYVKARERSSYAFALVSVAAALKIENGKISESRLALGGVAHKPWRDEQAEQMMIGKGASHATFAAVADAVLANARGHGGNDFKIPLAKRAIVKALRQAAAGHGYDSQREGASK